MARVVQHRFDIMILITARIRRMTGGYVFTGVWMGGYPIPGLDGGYPIQGLDWGGGTPSQVWMGGYPITGLDRGYPPTQVWTGVPSSQGTHHPGLDAVPPLGLDGVPPSVRRQSSLASTCYTAGAMPLAFTQEEDFLVMYYVYQVGCEMYV